MADYWWNGEKLTSPAVIPQGVWQENATAGQMRVLLWLAENGLRFDKEACAGALSLSPEECEQGLAFWQEKGYCVPAMASSPPKSRPVAVKPGVEEVLRYEKMHPTFGSFLETASARLGKPLSHGDVATLLYLLHTVGLPEEVILMEIMYAVSLGKANMRYVEQMALDWADRELVTFEQVEKHILLDEHRRQVAVHVENVLGLKVPLNAGGRELAEKWVDEWHFSDEMLRRAGDLTAEKTGKIKPAYMERILADWYSQGIDVPEKIPVLTPKAQKKSPAATNPETSSLNMQEFEADLQQYKPKFTKKTEG